METFIRCGNPNSWLIWAILSPILESSTVVTFSWSLQCDYWLFTRVHITFNQVQQDTFLNGYFVGHHPERHWNVQYLQSFSFCWRENSKVIFFSKIEICTTSEKTFQHFLFIVCYYHVTYAFQSESTLYSCLNVEELFARNKRDIWSLSDSTEIRTHNNLIHKRTLNYLARLTCDRLWQTKWLRVRIPLLSCFSFSLINMKIDDSVTALKAN